MVCRTRINRGKTGENVVVLTQHAPLDPKTSDSLTVPRGRASKRNNGSADETVGRVFQGPDPYLRRDEVLKENRSAGRPAFERLLDLQGEAASSEGLTERRSERLGFSPQEKSGDVLPGAFASRETAGMRSLRSAPGQDELAEARNKKRLLAEHTKPSTTAIGDTFK
jgi:hypothetical protein